MGALSVVISVNMLKGRYKASSGIPQVENAKFSLSGWYKYFLCVYCPLCRCCNMCYAVFFAGFCSAVSVRPVKSLYSYSTCLLGFCSTGRMESWFACSPLSSCSPSLYRRLSSPCKMDLVSSVFTSSYTG